MLELLIKRKKKLFSSSTTVEVSGTIKLEETDLGSLAYYLLKDIDCSESVLNLRGRPSETFDIVPEHLRQKKSEELVYLCGDKFELLETPTSADKLQKSRWSYNLSTSFNSFEGSKAISHTISAGCKALPKECNKLKPKHYSMLLPICINEIRVGMEFFKPKFFGSSLGQTPSIFGKVYIEVSSTKISFIIRQEGISAKSVPISDHMITKNFDLALNKTNIHKNLTNSIKKVLESSSKGEIKYEE